MSTFKKLKKEIKAWEMHFDTESKTSITMDLLGLKKRATQINKDEVLIEFVEDRTGLLENKENFISSNVKELLEALAPVCVQTEGYYVTHMGTLIYWDGFPITESINYIKEYLENRGEEIKHIKEKFNTLLQKEDLNREDLKTFHTYLILNNKSNTYVCIN